MSQPDTTISEGKQGGRRGDSESPPSSSVQPLAGQLSLSSRHCHRLVISNLSYPCPIAIRPRTIPSLPSDVLGDDHVLRCTTQERTTISMLGVSFFASFFAMRGECGLLSCIYITATASYGSKEPHLMHDISMLRIYEVRTPYPHLHIYIPST